ncbi:hypothetical protein FACS1894107_16100 [Planctomycetales bacterium]|nr:hypothetical protein FACS1894107_16100 [Planctomycetales bacterium]GHT00276.1 hypothetical protein FACS1894108_11960 [Planctomycetales bacterium]
MSKTNFRYTHCTFCGRSVEMVKRLIAGNDAVCICTECVSLCNSVLEHEEIMEREKIQARPAKPVCRVKRINKTIR